jgi:hypothetical protein
MVSDSDYAELHEFASQLGLPVRAFHRDHYDLPAEHRDRAIELGAAPVSSRDLVHRLNAAGLRRRPGTRSGNQAPA